MGSDQHNGTEESTKMAGRPHAKSLGSNAPESHADFPPPKTDKPRPHVCTTCTRGFARLEHLKRHERSHTKEKPFACEQCTRCFARRDLLLRHQQKLHMTAPPASRARGSRRERTNSATTAGSARVRKNSMAGVGGSGLGTMRPRANTISHVDDSTMGLLNGSNQMPSQPDVDGLGLEHTVPNGLPGVTGFHFRGMSTASGHHGNPHGLPKLETRNHNIGVGNSLHTAPALGNFDIHQPWGQPGCTVNPAQLHFAASPHNFGFEGPQSPFGSSMSGFHSQLGTLETDGNFPWLNSFENQMSFNENAIENSTPSESAGSPDGMSEMMLESSTTVPSTTELWPPSSLPQPSNAYPMDYPMAMLQDIYGVNQLSPKTMHAPFGADHFYPTPPLLPSQNIQGLANPHFRTSNLTNSETPSNSNASITSSNRQSSMTSVSTDSITDVTRNALLTSLSQQSIYGYNNFKTSQPQVPSPLSPGHSKKAGNAAGVPLPSTVDLQRYVGSYIRYFHPHLPFLHIPSLSFDSPAFTNVIRSSNGHFDYGPSGVTGGGGALILAMAAIGALYEYDFGPSKDLFEMSRTMIRLYTGERRKVDVSSNDNSLESSTPLWLVQAMLLNVIYGHNCGDKVAAGVASTLCGTVINLARSAKLVNPTNETETGKMKQEGSEDIDMTGLENGPTAWTDFNTPGNGDIHSEWLHWKQSEERKRTLFAVFILSSLLVSAYNHAPALMNSELRQELPCDENLWAADSAETWKSLGGSSTQHGISFATALTHLLTAHQREQSADKTYVHPLGDGRPFEPSTFGCLVLINALHNYIWETRQRHTSLEWTNQETEAMHARVEPALKSWQAAWSINPEHSVERPNPFGTSSLSADCIPLLDLAYLRLFVNLGRSKEAFFCRDWDTMAEELAYGEELIQHADHSAISGLHSEVPTKIESASPSDAMGDFDDTASSTDQEEGGRPNIAPSCKRERHLRKAAFYAANSLTLSDQLGVTFADFDSRELPLQSALCAFDCAQVLAEWISTLQQRVGGQLGMLGRDNIDFADLKAMIFLEKEDRELMDKIGEIVSNINTKLDFGGIGEAPTTTGGPTMEESGYGSKILLAHATMFEKASIWPLTKEISQSLHTQASHIHAKALASLTPST